MTLFSLVIVLEVAKYIYIYYQQLDYLLRMLKARQLPNLININSVIAGVRNILLKLSLSFIPATMKLRMGNNGKVLENYF